MKTPQKPGRSWHSSPAELPWSAGFHPDPATNSTSPSRSPRVLSLGTGPVMRPGPNTGERRERGCDALLATFATSCGQPLFLRLGRGSPAPRAFRLPKPRAPATHVAAMNSDQILRAAMVLAGGRSSRMGTPKEAVLLPDGRTMLQHVLDALEPLRVRTHLSVAREPSPYLRSLGLPLVVDTSDFEGPLSAIVEGLIQTSADQLLVVCCDQPLLRPDVLGELLKSDPVRPTFFRNAAGESLAPFPGLFPRTALESMRTALAAGERSPRRWIQGTECAWIPIADDAARSCQSLNCSQDLERLGLTSL